MHIWLLQTWEPCALDGETGRNWRTGMLAERLRERGDSVLWWTSQFSHVQKSMRTGRGGEKISVQGQDFVLIPALGYHGNTSLQRLKDHAHVARNWGEIARRMPKPDAIVASYPTIEICDAAIQYGAEHSVPVLVDVRDQYPDLYWENARGWKRWVIQKACDILGFSSRSNRIFARADGITSNGPGALEWARQKGGRASDPRLKVLPMSYDPVEITPEGLAEAKALLKSRSLVESSFVALYAGAIGQTLDLQAVVQAAQKLGQEVHFVFCGQGDRVHELPKLENFHFLGWQSAQTLRALQSLAQIGLAPYLPSKNFVNGVTNKQSELLGCGLPPVTSVQDGFFAELVREADCGYFYSPRDPNGLVQILRKCSLEREDLSQKSGRARQLFKEVFHPDAVYGQWLELIDSIEGLEKGGKN